jgi:4-hydroxybenzoate polyprenyltransferase
MTDDASPSSDRTAVPPAVPRDASDIRANGWVGRLPRPLQPWLILMRLDRPIGTWLLLLPCWWGLALAPWPEGFAPTALGYAVLFAVGAVVMRGAGCVVNDILDRKIDTRVARTRTRPIASGRVSVRQAVAFLGLLLAVGLAVLLQFNWATIAVGAASLLFVFPYPLMKRVTFWPQAWLGLTFNWGALVGWTAVTGRLEAPAVVLWLAGLAWTLGYDTIYAHQDKEDDAKIGVKSSALKLGDRSRPWVGGFYALALGGIAAAAWLAGLHPIAYAGLAAAGLHAVWQVRGWRLDVPEDCLTRFRSNRDFGLIVAAALLSGGVLA